MIQSKNIIVFRFDRMGDLVVTTPALRALREHYSDSKITAILSATNAKILRGSSLVNNIIIYNRNSSLYDKLVLIKKLRLLKPDISIVLSPKSFAYIAGFLVGATTRIGLVMAPQALKRYFYSKLLTSSFSYSREYYVSGKVLHHVDLMFKVVGLLGVKKGYANYEIASDESAYQRLKNIIGEEKVLGIHFDDRWLRDGWSMDTFKQLIQSIKAVWPGKIIVAYSSNQPVGRLVEENELEKIEYYDIAYLNNLSFGVWQALIKVSEVWLTTDGGSIHIASSVGTPVVTLIESKDFIERSKEWYPRGVPYRLVRREKDTAKVQAMIVNAIQSMSVLQPF